MKDENQIVDILLNKLESVYCNNCSSNKLKSSDEDCYCEECHRKNMNWSISEKTAKQIAKEILN